MILGVAIDDCRLAGDTLVADDDGTGLDPTAAMILGVGIDGCEFERETDWPGENTGVEPPFRTIAGVGLVTNPDGKMESEGTVF